MAVSSTLNGISSPNGVSSPEDSSMGSQCSMTTVPSPGDEQSCIVGMACRVPGASSPSKLWENIIEQRDLQRKMPEDRFNVDAFYHPEGTNKGTTNAKYGYFLDQDISLFDAGFFHISGKEAEAMDPQQRLLLEVVYEALENAGITLDEIRGSQTSVFCGCFTNDYNAMTTKDLEHYPKYTVTGTGNSILSNRISYFYNLHGPSATIDTACSSSLVAFHMGNQSLRAGEADLSIVVGSALHFDPNIFVTMTDLGMLSVDGRCRHGDAAGSGYVRGEGITAVILKSKSRAQLDGNRIRAVVRGTGINHDGKKQGITLPSAKAQAALIERTYRDAGLNPADTQYIECHGTGTKAGDPRELQALSEIFSPNRNETLLVGSVKSNIGHLEGASGVAGIIKATMALEHKQIPPNMHFHTPNPEVDFEKWKLQIPTSPVEWKVASDVTRRVSINSFGYGGANAHVILDEYTPSDAPSQELELPAHLARMTWDRPYLAPLSSHSEKAGKMLSSKFATYLESKPKLTMADFTTTLSRYRTMHSFRSYAIGTTAETMMHGLLEPLPAAKWTDTLKTTPRIGFVFTGQGAQWFAMGRQLIEHNPFFRQTLDKTDYILQSLHDRPDWSVVGELLRTQEESRLTETRFSQPICTALQLALVDLLAMWGVKPSAVVGHSSGELAASYAAGILSFENAMVAAYYRGLYMGNGAESADSVPGAMMAIGMTESETVQELKNYAGRLAIAAMNSPSSFTISGDEDAVVELQAKLSERKIFARRLQVAQAFHSHHMFPLAAGYERALKSHSGFEAKAPTARMFSSVTARLADPEAMGAAYFAANMTGTVKFSDALTGTVLDEEDNQNVDILLEVGPHPALKGPSNQTLGSLNLKIPYLGTLDRKVPAYESILSAVGQLYALGYPVDMHAVNQEHFLDSFQGAITVTTGRRIHDIPTYAWDHQRYWAETRVIKSHRLRKHRHSILGAPVPGSLAGRPRWRNYLRISELPWLVDHTVAGKVVFPGAGFINMAIEAAIRIDDSEKPVKQVLLKDISVKSALVVSNSDEGTEILLEMRPVTESAKTLSSTWNEFAIFSYEGEVMREHCTGSIQVDSGDAAPIHRIRPYQNAAEVRKRSDRCLAKDKYYNRLLSIGLEYGPTFRLVSGNVDSGAGFATAQVTWKPEVIFGANGTNDSILHPSFLDASIHPIFAAIEGLIGSAIKESYIPTFIRSMAVSGLLNQNEVKTSGFIGNTSVATSMNGPRVAINDVVIEHENGNLLVDIEGLELTSLGGDAEDGPKRSLFFGTRWKQAFDLLGKMPFEIDGILDAVELYAHQYPNAQILYHASSLADTKLLLDRLESINGGRRSFAKFVIQPIDLDVSGFQSLIEKWDGQVTVEEPATEEKFDVIFSHHFNTDAERHAGKKTVVMIPESPGEIQGFDCMLSAPGISLWKRHQIQTPLEDPVTILMSPNHSSETDSIATMIESSIGVPTVRKDFLSVATSGKLSGNVVVLYSLDKNAFFDSLSSDSREFKAAQILLSGPPRNVVWLTRGAMMEVTSPEQAIVLGLARSARSENENLRLAVLDIEQSQGAPDISGYIKDLLDGTVDENEIAIRNGQFFIPRILANDILNSKIPNGVNHHPTLQPLYQPNRPLALQIGRPGLLETLSFVDDVEIRDQLLKADELEIEVKASAINFRDIAASMGMIDEFKLGDECAGVVIRKGSEVSDDHFKVGDHVVALRPGAGAHRTVVRNPACFCYRLGPMSLAVATSIPLILCTAHFSLVETARLQPGETVLIHSAAGGVGQMAIQIAQMIGAKIIATAGSQAKRDHLTSTYGLTDDQILNSRDDSFVEGVYRLTNGKGVDVVLNSLAGKLLHATWACLAAFGRFIEIGKRDIHQNSKIAMDPFRRNVMFASVDWVTMFNENRTLGSKVFRDCCMLVHEGKIRPIQIAEFPYSEAEKAFRLLQLGTMAGKIVLVPGENDRVLVQPTTFGSKQLFSGEKTYLLVGGLGGLGKSLSEWLFRRGARKLAFLSRSGGDRPEAQQTVQWLQDRNVQVSVFRGDVTDIEATKSCIESLKATLAGVFQTAMVLQDSPFDKMTYEQWKRCAAPKITGTHNLHALTMDLALDFFVCFSSVSGILGSKGQANYSAANNYLDALCRHRRGLGLPATTMDIGMVVGIGAVSEDSKLQTIMERIGYDPVNESELFSQIETAISCDQSTLRDSQGFDAHQTITGVNLKRPDYFWATEPRFRNLYLNHDFSNSSSGGESKQNILAQLRSAQTEDERVDSLTNAFIEKIATILSVDRETVQPSRGLPDYGLDSIVAIEIRKWFFKTVGAELALFDVLGSSSIKGLVAKAVGLVSFDQPEVTGTSQNDSQKQETSQKSQKSNKPTSVAEGSLFEISPDAEIPMSTFQRRLWFVHNIVHDGSFLNLPFVMHIDGVPHLTTLRRTLEELKRRNNVLRTAYFEGDSFAQQLVVDDCFVELGIVDLSGSEDAESDLEAHIERQTRQIFDIEQGEIMRASLVKLAADKYALVLTFHHISVDRGSSKSFLEQFSSIYDRLSINDSLETVAKPPISYAEFTMWHNARLESDDLKADIDFWKAKYAEKPEPSKLLPFAAASRPAINDYKRKIHLNVLQKATHQRMKRICTRLGLTPAQFLIAAFRAFLYRHTEEDDLTIHMIDGNRPHPAVNDTVGFFVNMIPIRCSTKNNADFESLLLEMRSLVLESLEHSQIPFDVLVDSIGAKRDQAYFPLGQIVVNYQMHGKMPSYSTKDFTVTKIAGDDIPTACELNLEAIEDPADGLHLRLEYSSTLYLTDDMDRFLDNFVAFMTSAIRDHRQPISEISIVGPKELEHLKESFFSTKYVQNTWNDQTVVERIFKAAQKHPDAIAIDSSDGQNITYSGLVELSQHFEGIIQDFNIPAGSRIAIFASPGILAIAGMIACLLSRCGYVALDPNFASERLAFMVSDSGAKLILAEADLEGRARSIIDSGSNMAPSVFVMRTDTQLVPRSHQIGFHVEKNDPFYMIYTSGSTGKPKGVVLSQSNTQQMLSTLHHDYNFDSKDRFLHHSSICFDLSIVQIFSALTCGARVCVASAATRKDPVALAEYMEASQVTVTYFTPTQFALLIEHAKPNLQNCKNYRIAYFAGERLPVRVAKAFYDLATPAVVLNTWSPSELVVQTTIQQVAYPDKDDVSIPIGFPLANTRHYILDHLGQPLPAGFIGEIVVGGAQVGLGYLNRPEANSKSFIKDPFCSKEDRTRGWTRMFRSGDRGRFRLDGSLEFHGRIAGDKQIKLRGFRIDLGEVEQRLFTESIDAIGVAQIVDISVIARPLESNSPQDSLTDNRQLVAFVVLKQMLPDQASKQTFAAELQAKGAKHLNSYMLPNGYQFLDALPVTIGGKVDRQKLLNYELSLTFPISVSASTKDNEPHSTNGRVLAIVIQAFREILKIPAERNIGPGDSFFELGGQSVLMLRLQAKLKRALKVNLVLSTMFEKPTAGGIANAIAKVSVDAGGQLSGGEEESGINWKKEISLPSHIDFEKPLGLPEVVPSEVTDILVTGIDSFLGIHMLSTVLTANKHVNIHALGLEARVEHTALLDSLQHYKLLTALAPESVRSRVHCVPGILSSSRFGLSEEDFTDLGRKIQVIYHLGSRVSLLQSYEDLHPFNIDPVKGLVELATLGLQKTHIHHLSTWSVPHLQSWHTATRTFKNRVVTRESSAAHFSPEPNGRYGYFKSRWVAEMLMEKAATHGVPVTIYRSSATTANSETNVLEPEDDFTRRMILAIINTGAIPEIVQQGREFAIDFVPIDYMTRCFHALASNSQPKDIDAAANIYHIGNPAPLALSQLPDLISKIKSDSAGLIRMQPVGEWLETMHQADSSADAAIRLAALRGYFGLGHNMFALDQRKTRATLQDLGVEPCMPIGVEYLRGVLEREQSRKTLSN